MITFPKHNYTHGASEEDAAKPTPEENPTPKKIEAMIAFIKSNPEIEKRFDEYESNLKLGSNVREFVKEEVLKALKNRK